MSAKGATVVGPEMPFRFMTWNIYAHTHTNWAKFAHEGNNLESRVQMIQRHTLIVKAICQEFPDIIALQEVDTFFMGPSWDPLREPLPCGQRLTQYVPYQDYAYAGAPEGCAILLKRGVFELDPEAPSPKDASIYGCTDTGGKSATVLWARRVGVPNSTVAVVSVHLKGCPPPDWHEGHAERRFLLKEICRSLHRYPAPVLFAGDFNVRSGEFLDRIHKLLYKELGILKVFTPKSVPTSLMSDFKYEPSHRIDYIYLSSELKTVEKPVMGRLPGDGDRYDDRGPFGIDKGNGSDHRWLMCTINPKPRPVPYAYPATATTAPLPKRPGGSVGNTFSVMQWNVLSTSRTSQFFLAHDQPGMESKEQHIARHQRIARAIAAEHPDVVLLQDADETFLPPNWTADQPLPCGEMLHHYRAYQCRPEGPGTAVLVWKGLFEPDPDAPTLVESSVLPCNDNGDRTATVMWLRRPDAPKQRFAIASVHLKEYTGEHDHDDQHQRYTLLKAVATNLKLFPTPVIVAGDFGTRPHEISWLSPSLGKGLKMRPVDLKCSLPSALMPDLSYDPGHRTDYLYLTNAVQLVGPAKFGPLSGEQEGYDGRGPYGSDPGDGSDHRWIKYTLEILWNKVQDVDAEAVDGAPSAKRFRAEDRETSTAIVVTDMGDD